MVILHIACIKNEMFKGVDVAVPQHVIAQQKIEKVALLNIAGVEIEGIKEQFIYKKPFRLNQLSEPYNKPDIVVFHEVYYPAYLSICNELIKEKIPYAIVPHGCLTTDAQHKKYLKKKVGNFLLFNRYIRNAAAIQCLSEGELSKTKFGRRKFVGTNGVNMPSLKKNGFNDRGVRFVYIGRLASEIKGLDIMLEAFWKKKEFLRGEECSLELYGPDYGAERETVANMIEKMQLRNLVHLRQGVYGAEKEKTLLDSDVFVQTSRSEGMPLGILEALSYGLPCLVTQGTSLGEEIEKCNAGWMAETNADSVAETLERAVLDKKRWSEISANAVETVKSRYDWEKIARETVGTYREVMEAYTIQHA